MGSQRIRHNLVTEQQQQFFLKVFIEFCCSIASVSVFVVFFGHETCGILAPRPGTKPAIPALEGKVLTTGPLGKSLFFLLKRYSPFENSKNKK